MRLSDLACNPITGQPLLHDEPEPFTDEDGLRAQLLWEVEAQNKLTSRPVPLSKLTVRYAKRAKRFGLEVSACLKKMHADDQVFWWKPKRGGVIIAARAWIEAQLRYAENPDMQQILDLHEALDQQALYFSRGTQRKQEAQAQVPVPTGKPTQLDANGLPTKPDDMDDESWALIVKLRPKADDPVWKAPPQPTGE